MKIQSVNVTNYKAFLGSYELKFGGKNVFIYGENGREEEGSLCCQLSYVASFLAAFKDILPGIENN